MTYHAKALGFFALFSHTTNTDTATYKSSEFHLPRVEAKAEKNVVLIIAASLSITGGARVAERARKLRQIVVVNVLLVAHKLVASYMAQALEQYLSDSTKTLL